jgi:hypothetical protein
MPRSAHKHRSAEKNMKTNLLSIIAVIISLIACLTVIRSKQNENLSSKQITEVNALIQDAIKRRETELIHDVAPKIVEMTKNLDTYDRLKPKPDPSSIEEMVSPFFKMISTVGQ